MIAGYGAIVGLTRSLQRLKTSNTERRSRYALETSASATPGSPRLMPVRLGQQKDTDRTKAGSETPFASLSSVKMLLNPV
jgi:hypothetical protein